VQWVIFIFTSAVRGQLETAHQFLVASYPLVFFYLIACALTAMSQRIHQIARGWRLLVFAGGLVALDQVIKTAVIVLIPYQTAIPIIPGWLSLTHVHNPHGSWIAAVLNVEFVGAYSFVQWGITLAVLFFSILCHRYYIATNRKSLWADVVLLGILAAEADWICDMSLRGYVVDFIDLPGLVAADLKDILINIGVAAFFVEVLDNSKLSWRWQGWQKERDNIIRLVRGLSGFFIQGLRKSQQTLAERVKKAARPE
jgi:lipoprotein signal peptidase